MMISWGRGLLFRENWRVPRSVVCGMFWTAVLLLFLGMILLVISKHKGGAYSIWGGVLLGLGLSIVLVCLLLCHNAYRILAQKNKLPQSISQGKSLPSSANSSSIIHSTLSSHHQQQQQQHQHQQQQQQQQRRLDYPHAFLPLKPCSAPAIKFGTPLSALRRSELVDRSADASNVTPSRKKKVRLQNGEAAHDDVIVPENAWFEGNRGVVNFSKPKEVNFELPPSFSAASSSSSRHAAEVAEVFRGPSKPVARGHVTVVEGRVEYLTDEEVQQRKRRENLEAAPHAKSHSRTLSSTFRRTERGQEQEQEQQEEQDKSAIENVGGGSMRVKVRPIKSKLYPPEWVMDHDQPSGKVDTVNVIHF